MTAAISIVSHKTAKTHEPEADAVELAPAAVVRVAGWSLDAVRELDDPQLGALARETTPGGSGWREYVARYDDAIERGRRTLWGRTVESRRFMRALAVVNPALARGFLGRVLSERRNKKARHRETTLYRYLARAASRTEPCALWTGVALASWGPRRRVRRAAPKFSVAPDLAPFRAIVMALAERAPYPARGRYKLNPTLTRGADGAYSFWTPPTRGPSIKRHLSVRAGLDALLNTLARAPSWTEAEAVRALGTRGLPAAAVTRLFHTLREQGVLVGGLVFPRQFTDPWAALLAAESLLDPSHVAPWRAARTRLCALADSLRAQLASCEASVVIAIMDQAREALQSLCDALETPLPSLPRAPLRCDAAAPWRVELGPEDAARLGRACAAASRHEHAVGVRAPLVRAATRRILGEDQDVSLDTVKPLARAAADPSGLLQWDTLVDHLGGAPELRARGDATRRMLAAGEERRWSASTPPRPAGPALQTLQLSFTPPALGGDALVHGVGVDATSAYARVATLLAGEGAPLEGWLKRQYHALSRALGVDFVALAYDHPVPNVLAQPQLWDETLDLWGVNDSTLPSRGLRLTRDPHTDLPLARLPGRARPICPIAPTAASFPAGDPCLQALLLTSLHVPPVVPAGARVVHTRAAETEAPQHQPRLRLEDDSVVRTRRVELRGPALASLTETRGAHRFARWSQLAHELGWSKLLLLERDGYPPLLVDRDSPLAIEAAFEGAGKTKSLRVEEFIRDAWIGDEDDDDDDDTDHDRDLNPACDPDLDARGAARRHVAELVLPFMRRAGDPRDLRERPALAAGQRRPARPGRIAPAG